MSTLTSLQPRKQLKRRTKVTAETLPSPKLPISTMDIHNGVSLGPNIAPCMFI